MEEENATVEVVAGSYHGHGITKCREIVEKGDQGSGDIGSTS